jgi:EAL domain-containing protein (putative c-di-GMP-specific phosphodiesterase class I)
LLIELDLRKAIIQNQFEIYYQPKIDVQTRDIIGAEALLRWFHPQKGFISPGIFIPIAEESGLITTIDAWILDQVCQQIKSWQAENIFVSIAVNLSGVNFQDVGLCDRVATILQRHHIDPQYIELEVTETALIQNPEQTGKILQQLKNLGIKLALDDFGTGYSSLNYLRNFPFDHIKLDRSFVERVDEQTKNATILNAMILLAHGLDLHVVGEGVEREAEYDFLKQNHCDALQGYLFSPPVNVHEFKKLLLKVIPVNIEPSLTHQLTHQLIGSTDAQCHGQ